MALVSKDPAQCRAASVSSDSLRSLPLRSSVSLISSARVLASEFLWVMRRPASLLPASSLSVLENAPSTELRSEGFHFSVSMRNCARFCSEKMGSMVVSPTCTLPNPIPFMGSGTLSPRASYLTGLPLSSLPISYLVVPLRVRVA